MKHLLFCFPLLFMVGCARETAAIHEITAVKSPGCRIFGYTDATGPHIVISCFTGFEMEDGGNVPFPTDGAAMNSTCKVLRQTNDLSVVLHCTPLP